MTPDKLNEMASNMESLAASDYDLYIRERDDLLEAARYLRQCAEAKPVATVRVHDTGGNAGIAWSGVPTENAGVMRGGTPLYTHPQPPSAQADAVEALLADHDRTLKLLDDVREWIRSDVAGGACWPVDRFTRAELLARIDAELEMGDRE